METASRSERRRRARSGSKPLRSVKRTRVGELVKWGITSVSANIDALSRVRETIARTEQRLLLDRARSDQP